MIISDFHVHFHANYDVELFFNSIKSNFQNNCRYENAHHIICLTESANTSFFKELIFNKIEIRNWFFSKTNNANSILAEHKSGFNLFVIAGRQIVTKENLEVLSIGMIDDFQDGNSIDFVINKVISDGFIPIIPWGFGKWAGARGEVVLKIIEKNIYKPLFLGDNGNRPNFIKLPSVFQLARNKKIYNLQGSDPLPFSDEEKRPGSFGVFIDAELDTNYPYDSFKKIIENEQTKFINYGKPESYYKFFKHQLGMQIVKRLRK